METAYDAIFVADIETGIILEANKRAAELLERPLEEIKGIHQKDLHPPEEAERYQALFKERQLLGSGIFEDIYVITRSGRKIRLRSAHASSIFKAGRSSRAYSETSGSDSPIR